MTNKSSEQQPSQKPPSKNHPPKFGPISAILITVAVFLGAQIIAAIGLGLYGAVKGLDKSQIGALLSDSIVAQFVYVLASGLLILLLLRGFLKYRHLKWSDIGLKKPTSQNLWLALPVFGVYFVTLLAAISVVSAFIPAVDVQQEQQIGFEGAVGRLSLILVFVSLVVVPAVSEEILIRGFLYGGLVKKFSKIVAALLASLIFAIAHLQLGSGANPLWVAAIDTFILSLFLIWLREKTGNIYAGMLVHASKNTVAFVSLFILNLN